MDPNTVLWHHSSFEEITLPLIGPNVAFAVPQQNGPGTNLAQSVIIDD